MIRKPVANHQWTNSAFGSILRLFQVVDQGWSEEQREAEPDQDDEERRLGEQPPESLAVGMQDRQPKGLQKGPGDTSQHRQRTDQVDGRGAQRPSSQMRRRLGCIVELHFPPARSTSRRARGRSARAGYAGTGGGRLSKARPKS